MAAPKHGDLIIRVILDFSVHNSEKYFTLNPLLGISSLQLVILLEQSHSTNGREKVKRLQFTAASIINKTLILSAILFLEMNYNAFVYYKSIII